MGPLTKWSAEEDHVFRSMYAEGKTFEQIAIALKRTPSAVRNRRVQLGIKPRYSLTPKDAPVVKRVRMKRRIPNINVLKPKNGNMDSAGAIKRLMEFWDAA